MKIAWITDATTVSDILEEMAQHIAKPIYFEKDLLATLHLSQKRTELLQENQPREIIQNRINICSAELSIDAQRITDWLYAKSVLCWVWRHLYQPRNSSKNFYGHKNWRRLAFTNIMLSKLGRKYEIQSHLV